MVASTNTQTLGGSQGGATGDGVAARGFATRAVSPVVQVQAANFARAMSQQLPTGLLRKAVPVASVTEVGGAAKLLNDLSAYLTGRHQKLASMVDNAVRTGSPEEMMKVTAAMADGGAETDLIAKTIGKTVSALDQLTKLN